MNVESIMALIRMAEHGDGIIANLAGTILSLVERLRESERRAGLAELALEVERAKTASVRAALDRLRREGQIKALPPECLNELDKAAA